MTWGLPAFARPKGGPAELEQPTGTLNPGDGYVSDRYIVKLGDPPPDDGTESPWRGISGAAVFCGDLLTGVIAADPEHRGHAALTAVPAYLLLRDPGFRATMQRYAGGSGLRWEPVELQGLADQQSPLYAASAVTPAGLLTARRAVIPFHGRDQLLGELRAWASQPGVGVWLLHGQGGQGKSRLAHFFGEELARQGWAVLWPDSHASEALQMLRRVTTPLLVIVDYAETRTAQLTELLHTLTTRPPGGAGVKVLLLARVAGDWWEQATTSSDTAAEILESARTMLLEPLDPTSQARQGTYRTAVHAFATALQGLGDTGATGIDWTAAAEATAAGPVPVFGPGETVLGVQMAALAALLDTATAVDPAGAGVSVSSGGRSVEDRVLAHERRYWDTTATGHGLTALGPAVCKDLIAATIVLAPRTHQGLDAVLARVPDLSDQPAVVRGQVRDWLMSLYPGNAAGVFAGMAPDRVAERLVGRLMLDNARPCLIETLATSGELTDTEAEHLLTVCTRAAAHPALTPGVGERLTGWCTHHPDLLMPAAIRTATRVERPAPLLTALDHLIHNPDTPTTTLIRLHDSLPRHSQILTDAALLLARTLVDRRRHTTDPTNSDQHWLAINLNSLAFRLGAVGRREEALTAGLEAVEIYRRLVDRSPVLYLPNLAMSVNNFANRLAEVGRREEALAAASEAVETYRQLVDRDPDAYLPDLAGSVSNLAVQLGAVGRREEALTAGLEAVETYRRLVDRNPDAYLPDLARSVSNLAVRLGAVGRREEALTAGLEAVETYRRLVDRNPDAYLPDLARSVHNLANRLAEVGRREEALTAGLEAVETYRQLADRHPLVYSDSMARSEQLLVWL
ncbi:tetratricopeptide repeat protein [Nocardia nova]|uniref:tetratricopeptide repeat protein n=1 Tax=Nocardia nova TaxID=37330 RepID=UPI000CE9BB53|nr:tetratricopeptide repeat protein [Nocardia nova]PPI91619.1 hypothetical protein C5E46_30240 [Nocardia nova]